jgi:hypothetical protein
MEAVRERWTDDRMDDLNRKVDELGRRMDARFVAMDARFDAVQQTMIGMQRTMIHGFVAMSAAIVAGFGGMAGLIATQL